MKAPEPRRHQIDDAVLRRWDATASHRTSGPHRPRRGRHARACASTWISRGNSSLSPLGSCWARAFGIEEPRACGCLRSRAARMRAARRGRLSAEVARCRAPDLRGAETEVPQRRGCISASMAKRHHVDDRALRRCGAVASRRAPDRWFTAVRPYFSGNTQANITPPPLVSTYWRPSSS